MTALSPYESEGLDYWNEGTNVSGVNLVSGSSYRADWLRTFSAWSERVILCNRHCRSYPRGDVTPAAGLLIHRLLDINTHGFHDYTNPCPLPSSSCLQSVFLSVLV